MTTTPTPASQQSPATFCKACGGSGSVCAPDTVTACETCFGSGRIVQPPPARSDKDAERTQPVPGLPFADLASAVKKFQVAQESAPSIAPKAFAYVTEQVRSELAEARAESAPSSDTVIPWEDRESLYHTDVFSKIERMEAEIAEWRALAGNAALPDRVKRALEAALILCDTDAQRAFFNGEIEALARRATAGNAAPECPHHRQATTALGALTNTGWRCKDCGKLISVAAAPDQLASNAGTTAPSDLPPLPKPDHYDMQMRRWAWSEGLVEQYGRACIASNAGAAPADAELERLRALLNTPELHDFAKGVVLEAAHQQERWGTSHDGGKEPADWFWLIGYLGGKALKAHIDGNTDKALHHTISTAAALANWHAAILGKTNMRPGIAPPDAAPSNSPVGAKEQTNG